MLTKIQNPRISYISRILALPLIAFTVLAFTFRTISSRIIPLEKEITVVIDAGHGKMANGLMNGARAEGVYEDDIVLALAKKVAEINANNKINIVLTRTSAENVDLDKRIEIAKEKKADLFISLHVGASEKDANINGIELLVSNKNTVFQNQSQLLASVLKEELATVYTTLPELRKRKVGSWMLDKTVCPSVLIECGYITNKKDRDFITGEANQKLIAEKIITSIERYAAAVEKGVAIQDQTDSLPQKNGKDIKEININKNSGVITISYVDGSSEALSIEEAKQKKLISENATTTQTQKDKPLQLATTKEKPVYYLDGKEFTGDVNNLNPNRIESVHVLKAQSAIAKYGEKGRNGVIEIFTKQGNTIPDTVPKNEPIFEKAEIEAAVDLKNWRRFLEQNLQPIIKEVSKTAPDGKYTVLVKFLVNLDGSVSDIKAVKDPGYGLGPKVVELMKSSPKWKPALQNGRPVRSYHTQPITFVISNGKKTDEANSSVTSTSQLQTKDIHSLIGANKTDEIVSFEMMLEKKDGWVTVSYHKGNIFTASDKEVLQNISQGNKLIIWKINVLRNGEERKLNDVAYKL